jgi:hypothetical protein
MCWLAAGTELLTCRYFSAATAVELTSYPLLLLCVCRYWVVGVPLAAWLAFKGGMGIHGFWWGVAAGAAVQVGGWLDEWCAAVLQISAGRAVRLQLLFACSCKGCCAALLLFCGTNCAQELVLMKRLHAAQALIEGVQQGCMRVQQQIELMSVSLLGKLTVLC